MDPGLLPRVIRIGRERLSERGLRSADKAVSPLSWFTAMGCAEIARHMERSFAADFNVRMSEASPEELEAARRLVETKYGTAGWVNRLP